MAVSDRNRKPIFRDFDHFGHFERFWVIFAQKTLFFGTRFSKKFIRKPKEKNSFPKIQKKKKLLQNPLKHGLKPF